MVFAIIPNTADHGIFRREEVTQTDLATVASYLVRSVERPCLLQMFGKADSMATWTGTRNTKANLD